jgi:hypothetical protein
MEVVQQAAVSGKGQAAAINVATTRPAASFVMAPLQQQTQPDVPNLQPSQAVACSAKQCKHQRWK